VGGLFITPVLIGYFRIGGGGGSHIFGVLTKIPLYRDKCTHKCHKDVQGEKKRRMDQEVADHCDVYRRYLQTLLSAPNTHHFGSVT
jgi:hypothetical protein